MTASSRRQEVLSWVYGPEAFSRADSSNDGVYYESPRIVHHLDELGRQVVSHILRQLVVGEEPVMLDLMASWESHLPGELQPAKLVGLGLNRQELAANRVVAGVGTRSRPRR